MSETGSPAPLSATDYATIVLGALEADIRHVHVRATVSAAVAAIFVTQIDLTAFDDLDGLFDVALDAAILFLSLAAVSYFHYTQLLNKTRLEIVKELPTLADGRDLAGIAHSWSSRFMVNPDWHDLRTPVVFYRLGQACFLLGAFLTGVVLAEIFIF